MFAWGMDVQAISRCVPRSSTDVQFYLYKVYETMSAALNVPLASMHRRDMFEWLSERELLFPKGEVEAAVARALSALASLPDLPADLSPQEREHLEKGLAEEEALLLEAQRAIRTREPGAEG